MYYGIHTHIFPVYLMYSVHRVPPRSQAPKANRTNSGGLSRHMVGGNLGPPPCMCREGRGDR